MIQQNLIGKKAKIINYENTDQYFGYDDEEMGEYIGETGEIEDVIGCILDDDGSVKHSQYSNEYEKDKINRTILGIEMLGYSWHIDDIEILELKERKSQKTSKILKFDPKYIMKEGKLKHENKPKRVRTNSSLSKCKPTRKKVGSTSSNRNNKRNSNRTSKVRK